MVGIFETEFQHASSTPLPSNISIQAGVAALHDFEDIIRLSPDCRGCRPIPPPASATSRAAKPAPKAPTSTTLANATEPQEMQYYEVEDDLPFIPKRLWSGGVKYNADFIPTADGCDITVHAPGGFTSTNHWRLLRNAIPGHAEDTHQFAAQTKDLSHLPTADASGGAGWYVQIISDARCPKAFASFVKGFLKNSHIQLQQAFIEKLQEKQAQAQASAPDLDAIAAAAADKTPQRPQQPGRRPTLGRRRSSIL